MCLDNEMQGQYQINKHVGVALSCLKLFLSYNCNEQKAGKEAKHVLQKEQCQQFPV